jgi:hypothetical protein
VEATIGVGAVVKVGVTVGGTGVLVGTGEPAEPETTPTKLVTLGPVRL